MVAGRVAVVGAGLAGLSAAVALKRFGLEVDLIERSRLLGGKATSFRIDGMEVDNGQHVFLGCCTAFINFVEDLEDQPGGGELLYLQDRFDALLLARGRSSARLRAVPLPAPLHLAPALFRYRYLPARARLGVARALLAARTQPRPGESFDEWLDRHGQGAEARRAFWDPFFVPALNARLDRVDARSALFVITTAFLSSSRAARFGFARVPLAQIAERAARRVDRVHMRSPAAGLVVTTDDAGKKRVSGVLLESGGVVACDAVVAAMPPDRLERFLGDAASFGLSGLDAFPAAPIVDVHLWYDTASLGFGFAALLDSPIQWVFEKAPGYLCCSLSAAEEYVGLPGDDLVALCHAELAAVLPALRGRAPVRGAATRDREATFIPTPGLRRPGPTTSTPQVVIAGAWTDTGWPATMESAVRSGRLAAWTLASSYFDVPVGQHGG